MARLAVPLTDSRIRQVRPADKPVKLADGGGMYLLVRPDGSRYWRLDYRFGGKRKTLALGVYPEVTLAEARRRRRAAKAWLAEGQDPAVARKARKAEQPPAVADTDYIARAVEVIGEGVWDWDLRSGRVRHNAQWARLMGLDESTLEHRWEDTQACLRSDQRAGVLAGIQDCHAGQAAFECEHSIRQPDGSLIWVQNRGEVVERDADGRPARMVGSLHEVTWHTRGELRLQERNVLLQTIATVNEMLLADLPEQELMARICEELVRDCLFTMAWVGLVEDDGVTVKPVAEAGFESGYLAGADVRCDTSPQGQGPTGTAIRLGSTVINNDTETNQQFAPWRERARAQGIRSSAATPLRVSGRIVGALNVYSGEANVFGPGKVVLLEKLAADLGMAMGHRAALGALRKSEARFRAMAEHSADWIWSIDLQGRHTYTNEKGASLLGYTLDDFFAADPTSLVHPDDLLRYQEIFSGAVATRSGWEGISLRWRHRDGSYRTFESSASPLFDETGGLVGFQGVDRDITERRAAEAHIAYLAHHDALTGLPNRVLLRDRFEHALAMAERSRSRVGLLFLDLDKFKRVNDTLGHAAGDQLLLEVVARLSHCTRETDTISRQGGDEFIVLLNEIPDPEAVERIAGEILARIAEPVEIRGHVLNTSCSIGIAMYPDDGDDFDSLLQKADVAMYNAKDAGRNTWRFFNDQMNRQAHEHLLLQNRLHQAMLLSELRLDYQPQLEIGSGRVAGVEALLRWHNDELGDVEPERFIPVAEDCGLIVPIGAWVLREACRQAQAWRAAGCPELTMSVNLSALQFRRAGLVETVAAALAESGLPPRLLELELTESILLQDVENNLELVHALKALGVRLSIDDFGTGYSSLSYLKRFAVDRIKIDRSFVRDIGSDPDDAAIVRAVIQLARSLRLGIIAEGVETAEQLAFLSEEGCQEVQGYLFSRPLAPADFEGFLRDRGC